MTQDKQPEGIDERPMPPPLSPVERERYRRTGERHRKAADFRREAPEYPARFDEWKRWVARTLDTPLNGLQALSIEESRQIEDRLQEQIIFGIIEQTVEVLKLVVPLDQRVHAEHLLQHLADAQPDEAVLLRCEGADEYGLVRIAKRIAVNGMLQLMSEKESGFVHLLGESLADGILVYYEITHDTWKDSRIGYKIGYRIYSWGDWKDILRAAEQQGE